METTRAWVAGIALSVFIATASWGLVRMGLIGLAGTRYFQLREERRPESADWPRPRLLGRTPLLVASIVCWPAAVTFVLALAFGIIPSGAWYVLMAVWPVAAMVLLVLGARSPWAHFRTLLSSAASVKFDQRDGVLAKAFEADPQLGGKVAVS